MQFQRMVELLLMNNEIRGLEIFVSKQVLTTMSTAEKQKVVEVIKYLGDR